MNILILGTSNSLLSNGFSAGLASINGVNVENLSLGASPGVQFLSLAKKDFSRYDFVIFDSLPNDEEYFFLRNKYSSVKYTNSLLFEIFSIINIKSKLIILNIPIRLFNNPDESHKEIKSSLQKGRELLANKVGAQVINVDEIINAASGVLGISEFSFYKDRQHPHDFFMKKVGALLAEALNLIIKHDGLFHKDRLNDFSKNYFNLLPDEIFDARHIYRENSLIRDVFFIPKNNILYFGNFEKLKLIGFYCNLSTSNCFLKIKKNNGDFYSVRIGGNNKGDLMKTFIPIPDGDDIFSIEINDKKKNENNYYPLRCDNSGQDIENFKMPELGAFVFRNNDDFQMNEIPLDDSFNELKLNSILLKKFISFMQERDERNEGVTITSHSGASIFFNITRNKFMLLNKRLGFLVEDELAPVLIEYVDDRKVKLYIERGGLKYFISVLNTRLSLENDAVNSMQNSIFVLHKNGFSFSIKSGENYLRAIFSDTYDCLYFDRAKIGVCEKFSLIN